MNPYTHIANQIKAQRLSLNLSLDALASQLGISKINLQRYETDYIKNISLEKFELLIKILHLSIVSLLEPQLTTSENSSVISMPINYKQVAERIEKQRILLNFPSETLAQKLGISKAALLRYTSDYIKNMNLEKFQYLAHTLNISPIALLASNTYSTPSPTINTPATSDTVTPFPDIVAEESTPLPITNIAPDSLSSDIYTITKDSSPLITSTPVEVITSDSSIAPIDITPSDTPPAPIDITPLDAPSTPIDTTPLDASPAPIDTTPSDASPAPIDTTPLDASPAPIDITPSDATPIDITPSVPSINGLDIILAALEQSTLGHEAGYSLNTLSPEVRLQFATDVFNFIALLAYKYK